MSTDGELSVYSNHVLIVCEPAATADQALSFLPHAILSCPFSSARIA